MPYIEGVEAVVGGREEREKVSRREQWMRQYEKKRLGAISVLGGRCECGEEDPHRLQIVVINDVAKEWNQVVLYKRLTGATKPREIAKLVCTKCRFEEMARVAAANRKVPKGTGQFYWIGGVRVEQMRAKKGVSPQGWGFMYADYSEEEYWPESQKAQVAEDQQT